MVVASAHGHIRSLILSEGPGMFDRDCGWVDHHCCTWCEVRKMQRCVVYCKSFRIVVANAHYREHAANSFSCLMHCGVGL